MAISERTAWKRNTTLREIYREASDEVRKRLETRHFLTYEAEKQRAFHFAEVATSTANMAILKMIMTARFNEQEGKNNDN